MNAAHFHAMKLAANACAVFPASPIGAAYRAQAALLDIEARNLREANAPRSDARAIERDAATLRQLSEGL